MTRRWATKTALLAVVASTIGCDQASKHLASVHLAGSLPQSFLGDSIRLEYAENPGAFLSLGANLPSWGRTAVFSFGTGFVLLMCLVVGLRPDRPSGLRLGLALVFAGGASNLVDRVVHHAVVDFLNVGIGPIRTGIFNVADMAIMLGISLLVFGGRWRAAARKNAV